MRVQIREVQISDAQAILEVLNPIIETKKYTILDSTLTVEEEKEFIRNFPESGVFYVAEDVNLERLAGFQVIEPIGKYTRALDHVATVGTYVHLSSRRQGIGTTLSQSTFQVAKRRGFEKLFTQILASNKGALAFYKKIGFSVIGTATRHAKLAGRYIDEIYVEKFL